MGTDRWSDLESGHGVHGYMHFIVEYGVGVEFWEYLEYVENTILRWAGLLLRATLFPDRNCWYLRQ